MSTTNTDDSSSVASGVSKFMFKPSKWFFNKTLKLSLPCRQPESTSTSPQPPPPPPCVSPVQSPKPNLLKEKEFKQVFSHIDTDGDGKISSLELRSYFGSIGEYMSHEEAEDVINDVDVDGDGLLDFQEFTKLVMVKDSADEDIRNAFEMFEAEKGSGCITPKSLQTMLNRLGDSKSYKECEAMIRVYDLDENGILDFHEFHRMMA